MCLRWHLYRHPGCEHVRPRAARWTVCDLGRAPVLQHETPKHLSPRRWRAGADDRLCDTGPSPCTCSLDRDPCPAPILPILASLMRPQTSTMTAERSQNASAVARPKRCEDDLCPQALEALCATWVPQVNNTCSKHRLHDAVQAACVRYVGMQTEARLGESGHVCVRMSVGLPVRRERQRCNPVKTV